MPSIVQYRLVAQPDGYDPSAGTGIDFYLTVRVAFMKGWKLQW